MQLGKGEVNYIDGAPKKSFKAESVKLVFSYAKQHTGAEAWEYAAKNAQALSKQLLNLRAKVYLFDVRHAHILL